MTRRRLGLLYYVALAVIGGYALQGRVVTGEVLLPWLLILAREIHLILPTNRRKKDGYEPKD